MGINPDEIPHMIDQSYEDENIGDFDKQNLPLGNLHQAVKGLVSTIFDESTVKMKRRIGTQIITTLLKTGNPDQPISQEDFRSVAMESIQLYMTKRLDLDRLTGTDT